MKEATAYGWDNIATWLVDSVIDVAFMRSANSGDDGSNDLIVSDVIRRNELQAWFVAEHLVHVPLTHAK